MQRSIASTADARLGWQQIAWLTAIGIVAAALYLLASLRAGGPGFPLDDSWIHLTYARNLAQLGQWAFLPGQPTAGSTAPLWTFLLAPGFFLGLGPYIWPYALGIACLVGLGIASEWITRRVVSTYRPAVPWVGLVMVTEWHFVWAALSGMETLLFVLLAVIVLGMVLCESRAYLAQGVLIGVALWVRPDALTLLVPVSFAAVLNTTRPRERLRYLMLVLLGLGALLLPYLLMNLALSATPFPNTFYAKLAEYSAWQHSPLTIKLGNLGLIFFAGIGFVLLPAAIGAAIRAASARRWGPNLLLAWAICYALLYASRLPVYQNGRYLMPAMAVYILVALVFLVGWLPTVETRAMKLVRFSWLASISVISGIFYVYGASRYSADVALIQHEMVASAKWVADNLPPGETIAAHDIGALGYFAPQIKLIDLAGLVSPEVVPIITDEAKLESYIRGHGAAYVILVPYHYPTLAKVGYPVLTASDPRDDSFDKAMVIMRWANP